MRSRFRLSAAAVVVSLAAISAVGVSTSPASAATATCFGYTGNFNDYGADFVDWKYGPDECFGVAPSGTIWHTWSGAGAWKEMPSSGRALTTVAYFENSAGKAVKVVTETGNYYCNYDDYATNTWGGWYATSTDHC
ncbi:hypothetical protein ACFY94_37955 [Streptomyces griseorubiginosus]|uniref:hypothetical protein n=1 Tax=Streptomyces griseorubiginosus TaxID=67304 RepID=UPI0036E73854